MIKVKKEDNSFEEFDRGKIRQSVLAAGLAGNAAGELAEQIETWVELNTEPVTTAEIREKVIGLMESIDPEAAENYKSYKK